MGHPGSTMRFTIAILTLLALTTPARARCTLDDFLAPGTYGAGHRQLVLGDTARTTPAWAGAPTIPSRTLPTEIWYPIATTAGTTVVENAPVASGKRFPLVVNSPGLGDIGL